MNDHNKPMQENIFNDKKFLMKYGFTEEQAKGIILYLEITR